MTKKIGIWGFYYGNYGDDVMTIQLAKEIQKLGFEPYIFGLSNSLARQFQVNTCHSLDDLFNNSKLCIIAAGGILVNFNMPFFEKDIEEFYFHSIKYDCPLFAISIGGDGLGISAKLSKQKTMLFSGRTFKAATVRLKDDIETFNRLEKKAVYYPDMLLSIPLFWKINSSARKKNKLHIGLNLKRQSVNLLHNLEHLCAKNTDIVFHFLNNISSHNLYCKSDLMPQRETSNIKIHQYKNPLDTINIINSLDLVISHKLHLGVTALSLKVPFFSLEGANKAHAFLKTIDAESAIIDTNSPCDSLTEVITKVLKKFDSDTSYNFNKLEEFRKDSIGHMNIIGQFIDETI